MTFTQKQIYMAMQKFCDYQERCHKDVHIKLREFNLYEDEKNEIINELITQNYLNEERYAKAYAGGKFRQNEWGKIKIINELKFKQVSPYNIKSALQEINDDDYKKTLLHLIEKKAKTLPKSLKDYQKKYKVTEYLMQKGYEYEWIQNCLNEI